MKKITDISYDHRVHVQTLYARIRSRSIPVEIDSNGYYCIRDEYLGELLRKGAIGRPRKKALDNKEEIK